MTNDSLAKTFLINALSTGDLSRSNLGKRLNDCVLKFGEKLEIVKILPGRYCIYNENLEAERAVWYPTKEWVVARTSAWFGRDRRLSKG